MLDDPLKIIWFADIIGLIAMSIEEYTELFISFVLFFLANWPDELEPKEGFL